jgi:hypothetical protein
MKSIERLGHQGDVSFRRIASLPANVREVAPVDGLHVIAHSETGHHHVVQADGTVYYAGDDPLVCYLRIDTVQKEVEHLRPWDTHEPVCLAGEGAVYEIHRQREWTPEGERMVQD